MVGDGETLAVAGDAQPEAGELVSATAWAEGRGPEAFDLNAPPPPGGIRWFDVERPTDSATLIELLGPLCDGLEPEMLDDLLCPDEIPENRRWRDGEVRLASSFAVYAPAARGDGGLKPKFTSSAEAVYEPVELLAGKEWLITRWHGACLYRGAEEVDGDLSPVSRHSLRDAVSKRWTAKGRGGAGDLGVLVMHELALTYAPTHRRFHMALEKWELSLYEGRMGQQVSEKDEQRLHDLRGACARLRDWLNPLNIPGLRHDPDKAWLPVADHQEVVEVDKRIDKALEELSRLGDRLRNAFHLLHIQRLEEQRERSARLQRRIEILAPIFVVPTLVVGFYGANTWVPGEHQHWGFLVMVAAIVVLTCITAIVLWVTSRRHREGAIRREDRRRA